MSKWIWTEPLPGTTLFPHHRRWDCRMAIISALQSMQEPAKPSQFEYFMGRANAFNAIMFDCHDPMASAYARRIEKIRKIFEAKE